jgi:hypothetical protein
MIDVCQFLRILEIKRESLEPFFVISNKEKSQFTKIVALFTHDEKVYKGATLTRKLKDKQILRDAYFYVGPEVFLLCSLAFSITQLSQIDSKDLLNRLKKWWQDAPCCEQLKSLTDQVCEEFQIEECFSV